MTGFAPAAADDAALARFVSAAEESLRSVLRKLATAVHGPAAEAVATATELCDLTGAAGLRAAVLHPLYRYWRSRLTALAAGPREPVEAWVCQVPRVLAGPALAAAGELPEVRVPVTAAGRLHLAGLPWHLELGSDVPDWVLVSGCDGELLVDTGDRVRGYPLHDPESAGPEAVSHPLLAGTRTELDASDPWLRECILQANATPSSPLYPRRDLQPAPADLHRPTFDDAAALIARAWPEGAAEFASHVHVVVPFTSRLMAGWTSVGQLGAVYIRAVGEGAPVVPGETGVAEPVRYTAERLVHEAGHTRLNLLSFGLALFEEGGQHQPLVSPLRRDPRPAAGVYHAAFVLARVVVFLRRAATLTGDDRYAARAAECRDDFTAAHRVLAAQARLSRTGRQLLDQAVEAVSAPEYAR